MVADVALEVSRLIPDRLVPGLLSGQFTLHGGVVRDVAGRIVGHLAMPASEFGVSTVASVMGGPFTIASAGVSAVSGLVSNAQLVSLSRDVQQVLQTAMAGTALAGLGLATSMLGFWYLNRRLGHVEHQVSQLKIAVAKVQEILQTAEKAKLQSAINTYKLACNNPNAGQREQLLLKARGDFDQLAFFYKGMARSVTELAEVQAAEGFFAVACLGDAVCTSDLGMYGDAAENLRGHFTDWQELARHQCSRLLELESPARLLEARYVRDLPALELTRILDFAKEDPRGVEWIDVLRGSVGTMKWPQFGNLPRESIEFGKALAARNEVFGDYVEHFGILAEFEAPATEYARQLMEKTRDGYAIVNMLPTVA